MLETSVKSALVVGTPQDPGAHVLFHLVDQHAEHCDFAAQLGPSDSSRQVIAFATQELFLTCVKTCLKRAVQIHVLVRGPSDVRSQEEFASQLHVLAELAATSDMDLVFWGLTQSDLSDQLPMHVLPLTQTPTPHLELAQIEATGDITIDATRRFSTTHFNWRRFIGRLHLQTAPGASVDLQSCATALNRSIPFQTNAANRNIVMVVSNGVGLGHLTRLSKIAAELAARHDYTITFWCYSRAAVLLSEFGYETHIRQTAEHLKCDFDPWHEWESAEFSAFLKAKDIHAIVVDGSTLLAPIKTAQLLPENGHRRLIWVRRGMWKSDADTSPLQDSHFADLIAEPADLAQASDPGTIANFQADYPGLANLQKSPPIVSIEPDQVYSRWQARRKLGHISRKPLCLVNLGGDTLASQGYIATLIEAASKQNRVRFIAAKSPFAFSTTAETINSKSIYPIAKYLAAFDGVICAAGYNSFHETLTLCDAPVLFVPAQNARLDDQAARAYFAAHQDLVDVFDLEHRQQSVAAFDGFLDAVKRKKRRNRHPSENGASVMAQIIVDTING